jgi:hypothetical protein
MPSSTIPFPGQRQIPVKQIAAAVDALIDLLDAVSGDADEEANGDELDDNGSEEDFMRHRPNGPGCAISDPDCAVDDLRCDPDEGI